MLRMLRMIPLEMHDVKKILTFKLWRANYMYFSLFVEK